jgi:hypothetical protein
VRNGARGCPARRVLELEGAQDAHAPGDPAGALVCMWGGLEVDDMLISCESEYG